MINTKKKFKSLFKQKKSELNEPDSPAIEPNIPTFKPGSPEWNAMEVVRKKRAGNRFSEHRYESTPSYQTLYHSALYNTHNILQHYSTGIDRLKIYTNNYLLKDIYGIVTHSKITDTDSLTKEVEVSSWTEKGSQRACIEIRPDARGISKITCFDNGMRIDMNPATVLTGNNMREIRSPKQLAQALESVQETIEQEYHLKVNLLNSLVSYIELSKTEEMPRIVSNYTTIFDRFKFPRMSRTTNRNGNATYKNKRHSVVFYDKKLHLQGAPSHLLRIEYQLKKKRKVEELTKDKLSAFDVFKKWDAFINRPYKTMISNMLNEPKTTQAKQGLTRIDGLRQAYFAAKGDGQSPQTKALLAYALSELSQDEIEAFSDTIRDDAGSSTAYHFRENTVKRHEPYTDAFNSVSLSQLRQEIKDAFAE